MLRRLHNLREWSLLTLALPSIALADSAQRESVQATRQHIYHPEHRSRHVTRLHRYDHSGIAAFLEREADWHAGRVHENGAHKQAFIRRGGRENLKKHGFLQISAAQANLLRQHHEAWVNRTAATSNSGLSRMARYTEHKEHLERPTNLELSALQRFTKEHIGVRNGRAVTRMSSLASQYVGPIGVGTIMKPKGCTMPGNSFLHLEAEQVSEEELTTATGEKVCQAADQSKIWVVFDTGSTNIWVASDLCEYGPCSKEGRKRYNHTKSLTFTYPKKPTQLTVEFGTGKLVGPTGVDDFHIGPFSVFQQTFGMIQSQNGSVFEDVPFEGILGLAFPAMSANKAKPFFDTVVEQKALQNNEFAFYFSRDTPSANAIFWGGVEKGFYKGKIEYFPVADPYYWAVNLHSFQVGDECLLGPRCKYSPEAGLRPSGILSLLQEGITNGGHAAVHRRAPMAIVDTGTTYFTAEGYLFDEIMDRIPPAVCSEITDKTHPPITYTLLNKAGELRQFVFTKDMYMTEAGDGSNSECSPAFMRIDIPAKHGPAMVLGEVFLRHYFAVFDRNDGAPQNGQLGLAPSVHTKDALKQLHELTRQQPSFEETRGENINKYGSSFIEIARAKAKETEIESELPLNLHYGRRAAKMHSGSLHLEASGGLFPA